MKDENRWTKKRLAIELSRLMSYQKVDVELEQYATPSEIAGDWLWRAGILGDIVEKVSADLACGPGILGCGALLLGARKVIFVDKDRVALELAKKNVQMLAKEYDLGKTEFICSDIGDFSIKVSTVLQNPPFGTKIKHHDKRFLEKAFTLAPIVYSMHKLPTRGFVEAISKDFGFGITDMWPYKFRIAQTLPWHKKKAIYVEVGVWRMMKG